MPRPRFNNLPKERQNELLEGAANEFARNGYEGGSLNNIIAAIGLSKGAFYYYFDDKADLFSSVIHYATERVIEPDDLLALEGLDAESFWPKLELLYAKVMERLHGLPWLAGLGKLFYSPPSVDGLDAVVAEHFEAAFGQVAQFLELGRELGVVRDDVPSELLQAMVIGALEGSDRWFVETWESMSEVKRNEMAGVVFSIVRRVLTPPLEKGV